MLKLFRSLFGSDTGADIASPGLPHDPPPHRLTAAGAPDFDVVAHLKTEHGFPLLDWESAQDWVDSIPAESDRPEAWLACERAWLEHLRAAMGSGYRLVEGGNVIVLSSLEAQIAQATLRFVDKTLTRIVHVLAGVARPAERGKQILVLFDDEDGYYQYIATCYPDGGEFARSGGMYIHSGCGHFVTVKADLAAIEPVIAHELTHACLGHLPIPAWLNEGLAVNTESRLCPPGPTALRSQPSPQQMHARHLDFWGPQEIQEFWAGTSFLRPDVGCELSYDLARILVSQLSEDWDRFSPFAVHSKLDDSGASAAREHLGLDLGEIVAALLERDGDVSLGPNPATWDGPPQKGEFRATFTGLGQLI